MAGGDRFIDDLVQDVIPDEDEQVVSKKNLD